MNTTKNLSEAVKRIRKQHGLSQSELADIAGISLPSLSRLERGKETIRLDLLTKVAESLGYRLELVPIRRKPLEA